jgi:RecA-family ATPase
VDQHLEDILKYIDPSVLSYEEWAEVGMALRHEGYSCTVWEDWSRRDGRRFRDRECERKWESFRGTVNPVTAGTIVKLAKEHGYRPPERDPGHELEWDAVITKDYDDDLIIADPGWIEEREVTEPEDRDWDPAAQLTKYLEILFEASENVGYVTQSWEKDGRFLPTKGSCDRTAGELIQELGKCKGDLGAVLGDYKPEAGAWIRFNPLDGKGVKNENVTDFRYALVESDTIGIDRQNTIVRELELPVAALVHSGGKSLHAIVKIEAGSYNEYRKRVDYLYGVCKKNGLDIDAQNKNPSRLSRMPGIVRNGNKQFLVDTNIGKASWAEWEEWTESVNDNLPEPENLTEAWNNMPPLADSLIDGILRQGHKMLLAGPSKAAKSYLLIELAISIAEGARWLSWRCAKGKILYVNLELDRASCLHRFKDVYAALNLPPKNIANIEIWNLRGKSIPMDKLAPKLIRRAAKKNYTTIIIDPIYKVITGDENSADQMARFCNQFDLVCHELGAAVIYCHHHSKGLQGNKRSMDRASGSGVFARDPDALLDLIELELGGDIIEQQENRHVCAACERWLDDWADKDWRDVVPQDDALVSAKLIEAAKDLLPKESHSAMLDLANKAKDKAKLLTGWRIEATLREFPKPLPVDLWFDYPVHHLDGEGILADTESDGEGPPWKKATKKRKSSAEKKRDQSMIDFENAVEMCNFGEPPKKTQVAAYLGVTERTVENRMKKHGGYISDPQRGYVIVKTKSDPVGDEQNQKNQKAP